MYTDIVTPTITSPPSAEKVGVLGATSTASYAYCPLYTHRQKFSVTNEFIIHLVAQRWGSVVRAFAHGVIGRRMDPSWWNQCSRTGATKAVVCANLSVGWCI